MVGLLACGAMTALDPRSGRRRYPHQPAYCAALPPRTRGDSRPRRGRKSRTGSRRLGAAALRRCSHGLPDARTRRGEHNSLFIARVSGSLHLLCHSSLLIQYAATCAIRALPDASRALVPIIAISASVLQSDIDKCIAAGMSGHVAKPIESAALAACVRRWVPRR